MDSHALLDFEIVGQRMPLRAETERDVESAHAAALKLVAALTLPVAAASGRVRGGLAPWQKRKVDRYLRERLERPLPLKELAAQVQLSVSHFCRAFKESFGTTPHMYILRLRLEFAQRVMLTTGDSLSQIALACGLADQAHLSKLFRRHIGETPSAWRRRNLTDAEAGARSRRSTGLTSLTLRPDAGRLPEYQAGAD